MGKKLHAVYPMLYRQIVDLKQQKLNVINYNHECMCYSTFKSANCQLQMYKLAHVFHTYSTLAR